MRQQTVRRQDIVTLVRAIRDYQKANSLTDAAVAKKLGMPRTTWNNARIGLYRPGLSFARKAAASREFRQAAERVLLPVLDSVGDAEVAS